MIILTWCCGFDYAISSFCQITLYNLYSDVVQKSRETGGKIESFEHNNMQESFHRKKQTRSSGSKLSYLSLPSIEKFCLLKELSISPLFLQRHYSCFTSVCSTASQFNTVWISANFKCVITLKTLKRHLWDFSYLSLQSPPSNLNATDQFAFQPGSSTHSTSSQHHHHVENQSKWHHYIDFSKAFDSVRHFTLL